MAKTVFEAKGKNGQIVLDDKKIIIRRKGFLSFLMQGLKGEKTIPIKNITSVQYKGAGYTAGYIQFSIMGSFESKSGLMNARYDENTVLFGSKSEAEFLIIKDYIENFEENQSKSLEAYLAETPLKSEQEGISEDIKTLNNYTPSSQTPAKLVLGLLLFPAGGFFLISPINNLINNLVSLNAKSIEAFKDKFTSNPLFELSYNISQLFLSKTTDWQRFSVVFVVLLLLATATPDFQAIFK